VLIEGGDRSAVAEQSAVSKDFEDKGGIGPCESSAARRNGPESRAVAL
jgi:hypothetical protein